MILRFEETLEKVQSVKSNMQLWRNWQTRTFEGRVGNRMGSSPISCTIEKNRHPIGCLFFSIFAGDLKGRNKTVRGTVLSATGLRTQRR